MHNKKLRLHTQKKDFIALPHRYNISIFIGAFMLQVAAVKSMNY